MGSRLHFIPRPLFRFVRWLSAPIKTAGQEGDDELRASMFRRIEAVLASAVVTLIVVALAAKHHPTALFKTWLVVELVLFGVRAPLAVHIIRVLRATGESRRFHAWTVDLFIIAGTIWSASLGFGAFISLSTQDPGLSVLVSLLAIGTASGQSARNPSSPRLNSVQMCLIMFPFTAGACVSDIPLVGWCLLLVPLYLAGMLSITLQLHDDYVTMILARMEDRRRALHCALTGLPNRAFFDESLQSRLDSPIVPPAVVLCIDLDGFKAVNDEFGHPMGDVLLQQVAVRLRALMRGDDVVARLGGDEFAVLTGDPANAGCLASDIVAALGQPFRLTAQHTARIGASIGIVVADESDRPDAEAGTRLLARADNALYAAKRAGRGTYRVFDRRDADEPGRTRPLTGVRVPRVRKAS